MINDTGILRALNYPKVIDIKIHTRKSDAGVDLGVLYCSYTHPARKDTAGIHLSPSSAAPRRL